MSIESKQNELNPNESHNTCHSNLSNLLERGDSVDFQDNKVLLEISKSPQLIGSVERRIMNESDPFFFCL